jgi:hypothetical protein
MMGKQGKPSGSVTGRTRDCNAIATSRLPSVVRRWGVWWREADGGPRRRCRFRHIVMRPEENAAAVTLPVFALVEPVDPRNFGYSPRLGRLGLRRSVLPGWGIDRSMVRAATAAAGVG